MGNCKYCNREINNQGSLGKHQKECKLNPDRITYTSNFVKYNTDVNNGVTTKNLNQFQKAIKLGVPAPIVSAETRRKMGEANRGRIYTDEDRARISAYMKEAVIRHPDSYSNQNVCGRTKLIQYNGNTLNGQWELTVAKWLDSNSILWTNKVMPFQYEWENKIHNYFPDFYLPNINVYIEVKGYERERDRCKWKNFPHQLIIIKLKEINLIQKNEYKLFSDVSPMSYTH